MDTPSRPFFGRKRPVPPRPIPPGQYFEHGFPVLSAGPTPRTPLAEWTFCIKEESAEAADGISLASWSWEEFQALPQTEITVDIHCVTKWTKLDTHWKGVTIDDLLDSSSVEPTTEYAMAFSDGGYTTNLPLQDVLGGKAMIALEFDGEPLEPEHGGPARLLVPRLYFWKSAKWVRGFRFMESNEPGFWEGYGYHLQGDPWREERYQGD